MGTGGLAGQVVEWVLGVFQATGYVGIGIIFFLEIIIPPIPAELLLPLFGFMAGQGQLSIVGVFISSTVGSTMAALVLYWIARKIGRERLRAIVDDYGKWFLLRAGDVDRVKEWFDDHGDIAVLIGRLIPTVRSYISVPAGFAPMSLIPFILLTTIGIAIWNGALLALGWFLGNQWQVVQKFVSALNYGVIALGVIGTAIFIWYRWRSDKEDSKGAS